MADTSSGSSGTDIFQTLWNDATGMFQPVTDYLTHQQELGIAANTLQQQQAANNTLLAMQAAYRPGLYSPNVVGSTGISMTTIALFGAVAVAAIVLLK